MYSTKLFCFFIFSYLLHEFDSAAINSNEINGLQTSESYTHMVYVDEEEKDLFTMYWKFISNDEIQFELHCKTTGWLAVGLTQSGGMKGSDIAIGWVDGKTGKATLKDCHADGNNVPVEDEIQNWDLIDGKESNGYTILKIKRKLRTCDEFDKEINEGSTYMIFAWHNEDPKTSNGWKYHGANRRPKTVLLRSYQTLSLDEQTEVLPHDTFTYDLLTSPVEIPKQDTFYFCETFKLPKWDQNLHLVQFEMLINKTDRDIVHHFDTFMCNGEIEDEKFTQECGPIKLPEKITSVCQEFILAWSVGGQYNYSFPIEAGVPFKQSTASKYILVVVHYDNSKLESKRIGSAGLRLYLTPSLRKHDLGLLTLGIASATGPLSFILPPNSETISYTSTCYPNCMNQFIPEDGLTVVSGILHTHLAGRSIKTSLIRNDEVIQDLVSNPNYDFNYQYIFDIKPVKIYKDDILITQCRYNSENKKNYTFIGFSTVDEMCYSFIYYYPQVPKFKFCSSSVSGDDMFNFYNNLIDKSLIPDLNFNKTNFNDQQNLIKNALTSNSIKIRSTEFKKFYEGDYKEKAICGGGVKEFEESITKPSILRYFPKENLQTPPCN